MGEDGGKFQAPTEDHAVPGDHQVAGLSSSEAGPRPQVGGVPSSRATRSLGIATFSCSHQDPPEPRHACWAGFTQQVGGTLDEGTLTSGSHTVVH